MKFDKLFKYKSEDNVVAALYFIGLLVFIPLVLLFFYLRTEDAINRLITGGYSCAIRNVTGLNCPGCGGTRASFYLARFRFIDSFKMNATVLVSSVLYLFFMIKESLHRLIGTKGTKENQVYILIGIFVVTVVVRWIVCNWVIPI